MRVRPSDEGTYEHFWHKAGNGEDLLVRFRANGTSGRSRLNDAETKLANAMVDTELMERAIGVVSTTVIIIIGFIVGDL